MPIPPDRIAELLADLNEQFTNPQDGCDWGGWFESLPESDWDRTATAEPGTLVLTDGTAFVYQTEHHQWSHDPDYRHVEEL